MKRRATLLGIAPAPDGSGDSAPSHSVPPSSPGATSADGASKFEAAAQLLEQKRASMAPKAPTAEDTPPTSTRAAEASSDKAETPTPPGKEPPAESADAKTPPGAEVAPESGRPPRSERPDGAPKSRRRSSAPPPQRGLGIIPVVIAAAVFVVMFLVGAMRAMRDELRDTKPSAMSPSSVVESAPAETHAAAPAAVPEAPPAAVAPAEPATAETPAPASATAEMPAPGPSTAEPVASASAEPASADGTTRVMVRSAVAGAKFFRNGKQVGMNSVIVELAPGEKRAFEVNLPGYVSRKVVIDGSRSEVVVYLPRISQTSADETRAASDQPAPAAPAP